MTAVPVHARLGDVCTIIKGKKPKRILDAREAGSIPYVLIETFQNPPSKFTKEPDLPSCTSEDVLMVMDGARSGLVTIGLQGAIGSTLAAIRPKTSVMYPKYLYYWLTTNYDLLNQRTAGSAIPHVDRTLLQNLVIPTPALHVQMEVSSILERTEKLLHRRMQTNMLTRTMLQSVFLKMFGDPITNPMGWQVVKLISVCHKITDGTHKTPKYVLSGVPFLSVKDIVHGHLDFTETRFISQEEHAELVRRCRPEFGDALYTKVGVNFGRATLVDTQREFSIFVSVALIKPKREIIDSRFLVSLLSSDYVMAQARRRVKGIGVPDLHLEEIRDFDIILPPLENQEKFSEIVKRIEAIRTRQEQSTQEINELFGCLRYKAFRGDLALREAGAVNH